ncbi:AAA family ATPase [Streptomyces sp. NPDC055078]
MTFSFAPATREQAKARIGLQGPAGSGKTKSGLRIAEGLSQGGPIGVIDTERGSALTYAPVPGRPDLGGHEFGHMPMDTHDPRHLIKAIDAAKQAGIAVLIVDSWSHFWNGRGGLLTIVEEAGRKPGAGGSFGGWREGNPIEQDMLDALLNYPGHVIATMRTKGDYVIEGKKVTKVGVKAVQREGAEYELGLILDMVEGTGTVTKTRYTPLEGMTLYHPGEDLAEVILEQLGQGVDPVEAIMNELTAESLTYQGARSLHARARNRGLLSTGQLHPRTGEPSTIEALIVEYGSALKAAEETPVPASAKTGQAPPAPEATSGVGQQEQYGGDGQEQAPHTPPGPTSGEGATAPQMRKIFASFKDLDFTGDRDRRLRAIGLLIGHEIASQNELTFGEASDLIEILGGFDSPDGFKEHLNDLLAKAQQPVPA